MSQLIASALEPDRREIAGNALRRTVVDLIGLSLIAKHIHWNVVGPNFRSVHLDLDELVAVAREFTDKAAERAAAIGVNPDGRVGAVANTVGDEGHDAEWQQDSEVIATIVDHLAAVIERLRERITVTESADPVTHDLLIDITAQLEKLHWMWQAQTGDRRRLGTHS
ncbi:DNA starvation/stationary phase protection protein [Antrihabitans stalactiti]|uniref:Dps family protein n=1 Tax=Antrihabitans stalactiti TaxID=2584121 RepID=UPI0030B82647